MGHNGAQMRLDDCYRTLELPFGAPEEEVKRAYRDLTKVWHPDRFAHDPSLRAKAEEKLKKINEAYETIGSARGDARGSPLDARDRASFEQARGFRNYVVIFTILGFLILFRRPSLGGLLVAALCFIIAIAFLGAMRRVTRRS